MGCTQSKQAVPVSSSRPPSNNLSPRPNGASDTPPQPYSSSLSQKQKQAKQEQQLRVRHGDAQSNVNSPKIPHGYNDAAWTSIWESLHSHICDPMDVPAVLWDSMAKQINRLSATEMLLVQRRVRQVVGALPKSNPQQLSAHKMMNRFIISSTPKKTNGSNVHGLATAASTKDGGPSGSTPTAGDLDDAAADAKTMVEKYHQIDEYTFKRIFSAGDYLKGNLPVVDPLSNLFLLATYLSSPYLWERTFAIAKTAADRAGLVLDVNFSSKKSSETASPPQAVPPMPVNLTDYLPREPFEVMGANLPSIAFLVSLAIRGTREQRLQLLFFLSISLQSLTTFLNSHPAGGLPTWLLEVGKPVVISLASLSHYYHFGRAFCPLGLEHSSAKKRRFVVNASAVIRWTTHILANARVEMKEIKESALEDTNKLGSTASSGSGSANNVSNDKSQISKAGAFRARRGSGASKSGEDATVAAGVASKSHLQSKLMQHLQAVRDGRLAVDEDLENVTSGRSGVNETTLWTMDEFVEWADSALDEEALHAIFFRLFGAGVFPSAAAEKKLVQDAWVEWQTSDIRLWSEGDVYDSLEPCSRSARSFFNMTTKDGEKVKTTSPPWGGIGGFDGKGGLGYGIMYCIDKKWWDDWLGYVGWSLDGERVMLKSTTRPGELSSETLLHRMSDVAGAGTLGSYEIMKENVSKDIDYVLVPPAVWDILYEMYSGGPPIPRMVLPPQHGKIIRSRTMSGDSKQMEYCEDVSVEVKIVDAEAKFMRIPDSLAVATHPWILHCSMCDPAQPYRRGDVGSMSIRIMATPDQPLWRLYAEILTRLPVQNPRAVGPDGRGRARLWKHTEPIGARDPAFRYGPWVLLCKNRSAILPILEIETELDENFDQLKADWQAYTDKWTVEGCGLANGDRILFEHAIHNKNLDAFWPREAAAKAGHAKRLADEDAKFRQTLKGIDDGGEAVGSPKDLIGMHVDAMDFSGRWYQVTILNAGFSNSVNAATTPPEENAVNADNKDVATSESTNAATARNVREVHVDFSPFGGHEEWIDIDSDRIALPGRFALDKVDDVSTHSSQPSTTDPKTKATMGGKKVAGDTTDQNGGKICTLPGYGACGLANLGNTCYANSAIQCISYMPLLRSYLLSAQYRAMGDLNKDNPLGTGGKLLEEFAELLRTMWSGKFGERSPTRFRTQLGKQRTQFSGSDQQDAQELLNYMLDVLHEDSNKVITKPYVEALEDQWVKENSLPRVGDEAWRRFLRRNRSIMGDVAMGQVLNTVTCPVCQFSSRNFDPFNLLSIPFPAVTDVMFRCTVVRRATPLNCPQVLNLPRKNRDGAKRYNLEDMNDTDTLPPSERLMFEEYVIPMSRLADIGDLRLRLQNICGISANRLRLCKAEEMLVGPDVNDKRPESTYVHMSLLPDKEGPCIDVAKNSLSGNNTKSALTGPIRIFAFELTISTRPMPLDVDSTEDEKNVDDDTVTEDEDDEEDTPQGGKAGVALTTKEIRSLKGLMRVYGDSKECRVFDTDPHLISKAISRSLWPTTEQQFKLGLRVDAIDHRNHWFPGSVVEIIPEGAPQSEGVTVRIHFDNFSTKWDETYTIEEFTSGKVRPLYSHAAPRPKPTEFIVHHRFIDPASATKSLFGQSFLMTCQNEWSTARAGAHILAQVSRYLYNTNLERKGPSDMESVSGSEKEMIRMSETVRFMISEMIDLLLDCDRTYTQSALGLSSHGPQETETFSNPNFDASALSANLVKKVASFLHRLPFELKVCTTDSLVNTITGSTTEDGPYAFSLMRTIGNYMNAKHAVVLHWRDPPSDRMLKVPPSVPMFYVHPSVAIHRSSSELLPDGPNKGAANNPGSGGLHLGVCLTEFCKVNQLHMNDNWKCPRCKNFREGKQNMNLWRLPDLLTFHMKRFNCSARWREKISTKVNFPLTGLDMSEWCHPESPAMQQGDSQIYDLIAVVNHYGGMTGGHYVATCKATPCGPYGTEEVAYNFNGVGVSNVFTDDDSLGSSPAAGWRFRKEKDASNQNKVNAALAARNVSESSEPLWLQFDDDSVEPIPPRNVVSEMAYVLFYRRRRMSPANVAKYCTLE